MSRTLPKKIAYLVTPSYGNAADVNRKPAELRGVREEFLPRIVEDAIQLYEEGYEVYLYPCGGRKSGTEELEADGTVFWIKATYGSRVDGIHLLAITSVYGGAGIANFFATLVKNHSMAAHRIFRHYADTARAPRTKILVEAALYYQGVPYVPHEVNLMVRSYDREDDSAASDPAELEAEMLRLSKIKHEIDLIPREIESEEQLHKPKSAA